MIKVLILPPLQAYKWHPVGLYPRLLVFAPVENEHGAILAWYLLPCVVAGAVTFLFCSHNASFDLKNWELMLPPLGLPGVEALGLRRWREKCLNFRSDAVPNPHCCQ